MTDVFTENAKNWNRSKTIAGIISGVVSGLVMALVLFFSSSQSGQGFWMPLSLIGATFFGVMALVGGIGVALAGLGIHLIVSAIWGAIFAATFGPNVTAATALLRGLVYGVGVWLFMSYLILPWANPIMNDRVALTPGWFLFAHLVFGGVLSIAPSLAKSLQRNMERGEVEARYRKAA